MPLTKSIVDQTVQGKYKVTIADFTFDNSYATGGEALAPSDFGFSAIQFLSIEEDADGFVIKFDRANNKLMAFYADNDAVADSALIEVAAATDLSAVTVRIKAEGT